MFKTIVASASRSITRIISSQRSAMPASAPLPRELHSSSPVRDMGASTGDEEIWAQRYLDALCKQRIMRSQMTTAAAKKKSTKGPDNTGMKPPSASTPGQTPRVSGSPSGGPSSAPVVSGGAKKPSQESVLKKTKPSGDRKIPEQDGPKS